MELLNILFTEGRGKAFTNKEKKRKEMMSNRGKGETLATPFPGTSFSFGSMHCLTLSSLNLGVAYALQRYNQA